MKTTSLIGGLAGLAAGLMCLTAIAQETLPDDSMQKAHTFSAEVKRSLSINYLLYLPKDYKDQGKKRWPLMLFLHGAGERGTNLAKVAVHGPPKLVKQGREFPFILVSPQCPSGQRWSNEVLMALLDDIMERYSVDKTRVYVTGLSMGGFGSWSLAAEYPERFAAVAPICGGGDVIGVLLADSRKRANLNTLGVWAFHGAKDETVKLIESERMVDAFKRIGTKDLQLTVYPEAGHDSWTESYNNQALFDWFLKHERK